MSKRLKEILKLNLDPELREQLSGDKDEVDNLNKISKVLRSNGGKLLVGYILEDAKESFASVLDNYKTMSHDELVCSIAEVKAFLQFYNTIKAAEADADDAERMLENRLDDLVG